MMAIGLKRGVVELADHDMKWEKLAAETIRRLWRWRDKEGLSR
jgi:hypothetical protein